MRTASVAHVIDKLPTLDRGFSRTKIVASNLKETITGLNSGFGDVAVRLAWFLIPPELETKLINCGVGQVAG